MLRRRPGAARSLSARLVGVALGLRCELRRHRLDLVLAHVVVHVAPAGEHGGTVGLLVDHEAILDRPAGVTAGRADRLAVSLARGGDLLRRVDAEHVAAAQEDGRGKGEDEGECGAAHGRTSGVVAYYFGRAAAKLSLPPVGRAPARAPPDRVAISAASP